MEYFLPIIFNLHITLQDKFYKPHFTNEKTGAQRGCADPLNSALVRLAV